MNEINQDHIAVIGVSCEFPGAENPDEYWRILRDGSETISDFSDEELLQEGLELDLIRQKNYVKRSGCLPSAGRFDSEFFGYSPKEALYMDPQHRKFLEHSYKALESAGLTGSLDKIKVGVFAGCGQNNYLRHSIDNSSKSAGYSEFQKMIGNDKDYLATRVAYKLNLRGPAITVQTACSTSMTAVHTGVQNLLGFQCDAALCGGVSISFPFKQGYLYKQGEILSPDGYCRAFDENSGGTTFGSGVGIVILKRLEDAVDAGDHIWGVIRGIALNNDGNNKIGYTAPSVAGQSEVIATAHALADVHPEEISYIETHGTGTKLGDPIEVEALTRAFRIETDRKGFCAIGSVKPNIGHLDTASGIAGFIKVLLAMRYQRIPASIHYTNPNREMNIGETPFFINNSLREWEPVNDKRIAGISAFGVGGTNVHAVLEEWKSNRTQREIQPGSLIIPYSGRSDEDRMRNRNALKQYIENYSEMTEIEDISYSLLHRRKHFEFKGFYLISRSDNDNIRLSGQYETPAVVQKKGQKIIFSFPGQGGTIPDALYTMYNEEETFRAHLNTCFSLIRNIVDWNPADFFAESRRSDSGILSRTEYIQPILFSIEWSMAQVLIENGINPDGCIGHSLGELTAACISGVFKLDEAIEIVTERGRLMESSPEGAMLAVFAERERLDGIPEEGIYISALNAPGQTVYSGSIEKIREFQKFLKSRKIHSVLLGNHFSFHTPFMKTAAEQFSSYLDHKSMNPPEIPFISNTSGEWVREGTELSPSYWADHICRPVNFSKGAETVLRENAIIIEVGPGNILSGLLKQNGAEKQYCCEGISSSDEGFQWIDRIKGELWINHSYNLSTDRSNPTDKKFISLPTYNFHGEEFLIRPDFRDNAVESDNSEINEEEDNSNRISDIWKKALGYNNLDEDVDFFDLGGDSLIASGIIAEINESLGLNLDPTAIFVHPTINKLKEHVRYESNITDFSIKSSPDTVPGERHHLSPQQERLLFLSDYSESKKEYNLVHVISISEVVQRDSLIKAIKTIVNEQEVFACYFSRKSGEAFLEYVSDAYLPVENVNYMNQKAGEAEAFFNSHIVEEAGKSVNLYSYPLCRLEIHSISTSDTRIALYTPHIISDGWSAEIFRKKLSSYYDNLVNERPIVLSPGYYSDYVIWQAGKTSEKKMSRCRQYWKHKLEGIPSGHTIPLDRNRASTLSGEGSLLPFSFNSDESDEIRDYCKKNKITYFNFFLGVFSILLWKYSDQETIVIGSPYANREKISFRNIMGFFVKTIPLRIDLNPSDTMSDFFTYIKNNFSEALSFSELEFNEILDLCNLERTSDSNPLFQIAFSYQSFTETGSSLANRSFNLGMINRGISEYDLSLYMEERETFHGFLEYSKDLFNKTTISRMSTLYSHLVQSILASKNGILKDLSIMGNKDWQFLNSVNNKVRKDFTDIHFLDLYENSIRKYGDNPAITFNKQKISYLQMHNRVLEICSGIREMGIGEGQIIVVIHDRTPDLICSMLAVFWNGSVYLPIDSRIPQGRVDAIIEDSQPALILTDSDSLTSISGKYKQNVLLVDKISDSGSEIQIPAVRHKSAYILYTSGSTGKPKGAVIEHKPLANTFLSMDSIMELQEREVFLAFASASFDLSLIEICLPMLKGSSIVLVDKYTAMDGLGLKSLIERENVTFVGATPTTWSLLRDAGWKGNDKILAFTGGEACDSELGTYLYENSRAAFNAYGPTEVTICSSMDRITGKNWIPNIGTPNHNEEFFIVDRNLKVVPLGIPGELLIGGYCLASGYLNRDELTREKFVELDLSNGYGKRKLYRTGDYIRQLEDGTFSYLGRIDHQVKLRGYRIELGEIEKQYNLFPEITESVCLIHSGSSSLQELILFYRSSEDIDVSAVNEGVRKLLPDYMIPQKLIRVDKFPLMISGKIDRRKLESEIPESSRINLKREIIHPRNLEERISVEIWQNVLQVEEVSVNDDFFSLGGHSLLATKVIVLMNEKLTRVWKLRDLFTNPTIEELLKMDNISVNREEIPLIFPVSTKGVATPFYLVAGAYVNSYETEEGQKEYEMDFFRYFSNIIRIFQNERPLYGLRPQGILKGEDFHQDVSQMAEEYVREIKKIQPNGPYIIGGECLGGNVAYEIAQQLKKAGEEIQALVLLDTVRNIGSYERRFKKDNIKNRHLKFVKKSIKGMFSAVAGRSGNDFIQEIKKLRKTYLPLNSSDRIFSNAMLKRSQWSFANKLASYKPSRFDGKAIVLINEEWNKSNAGLGWDPVIFPELSVYEIPGDHHTRLGEQNLDLVGAILKRELDNNS